MSLKKKLLAVAAVSALSVATAVPAMALENEFHGMFLAQGIMSNLLTGTTGAVAPSADAFKNSKVFVDQRARLLYTAKANDDLKLVTHFELDGRWGDSSYQGGTRNAGYAIGGDSINLETKNVYLDFNCPITGANVKAGLQGITDAYKGVFVGNDAAGLLLNKKFGPGTFSAGWFRLDDARAAGQSVGKTTRDFLLLDAAYNVSKDVKFGTSYYYYNDDSSIPLSTGTAPVVFAGGPSSADIHMLGVNGAGTFGNLTLDGFFLYQNGTLRKTAGVGQHIDAFAANVGVKATAGVGAVKANLLYTSGSDTGKNLHNSFISAQNEMSSAYMESGIFAGANTTLLFRGNGYRTSNTDQSIVADPSNKGTGIMAAFIGYDGTMGKSFFNVNAAAAATAKKQYTAKPKAQFLGTEINGEVGYKLYDNLKASVQAAYVFLGPAFEGTGAGGAAGTYPNNPYLGRIILSYVF